MGRAINLSAGMGGGNLRVPSLSPPFALPCSQPVLTPLPLPQFPPQPAPNPPHSWIRAPCSIFQGEKCPLVPVPTGQLRAQGSLLSLHIPPSSLLDFWPFLLTHQRSQTPGYPGYPSPQQKSVGAWRKENVPPNPANTNSCWSCSLCRTCRDIPTVRNESSEQCLPIGILLLPLLQSSFVYPPIPRLLLNPRDSCWVISAGVRG